MTDDCRRCEGDRVVSTGQADTDEGSADAAVQTLPVDRQSADHVAESPHIVGGAWRARRQMPPVAAFLRMRPCSQHVWVPRIMRPEQAHPLGSMGLSIRRGFSGPLT